MSNEWTSTSITKFFKMNPKSKQSLFNAEKKGEIPSSKMVPRSPKSTTKKRVWTTEQIPDIGKKFGFIKKPEKQTIITFYMAKGGVLKTSLSHEFARVLALNGLKVMVIGLDIQCSITDIILPPLNNESLESEYEKTLGLYHFLYEKAPLEQVVKKTDIPTLDIIPETPDLNFLEKKLRDVKRREYVFKDKLVKKLNKYDVIIFDNSPSWNMLIENAITACSTLISPIGCEIGTYQSLQTNLDNIYEFLEAMDLSIKNFYLIPTMHEKTKLSQQIYAAYLTQFSDKLIPSPIRRTVSGQEAILSGLSSMEHDPCSLLAQDYYELITQTWKNITKSKTPTSKKPKSKKKEKEIA